MDLLPLQLAVLLQKVSSEPGLQYLHRRQSHITSKLYLPAYFQILLLSLLIIGIVGGVAAGRDAIIDELGDIAEAAVSLDQSYFLAGDVGLGIPDIDFDDVVPNPADPDDPVYNDCTREPALP